MSSTSETSDYNMQEVANVPGREINIEMVEPDAGDDNEYAGDVEEEEEEDDGDFFSALQNVANNIFVSPEASNPFKEWTRFELVQGLVHNGFELRHQDKLTDNQLARTMQELYAGQPMPEKPPRLSMDDFKLFDICARRIQLCFRRMKNLERWRATLRSLTEHIHRMDIYHREVPTRAADGTESAKSIKASAVPDKWEPPSVEKAFDFAQEHMVRDGGPGGEKFDFYGTQTGRHCNMSGFGEQCDLWNEGKWSDLSVYGPGLTNYFKFMKWGYWLLFMVFVIMLPSMLVSMNGTALPQDAVTMESISRLSVGNLGDTGEASLLGVKIPGCDNTNYNVDCYIDKSDAAILYGLSNLVAAILVLVALWWLIVFEKKEEQLDNYSLFASAYTVEVRNLPITATEESMKEHFERVTESSVAEVYFAFDNEARIYEFISRGLIQAQKDRAKMEEMYTETVSKAEGGAISDSLRLKLQRRAANREAKLRKIDDHLAETKRESERRSALYGSADANIEHGRPVAAFVTFQKTASADIARALYPTTLWNYLCPKEELQYQGSLPSVRKAPEPSTIIWENLHYTWLDRLWRGTFTSTVMLVLIVVTIIVAFAARVVQQSIKEEGGTDECPVSFGRMSSEEQKQAAGANPEILHCYCDTGGLDDEENCEDYHLVQSYGQFVVFLSSTVVAVLNMGLEYVIDKFANFEKPVSLQDKEISVFFRLFVYKYINMGLIFLVNEDRFFVAETLGMTYNATADFTVEWYQSVGVMLIMVQVVDIGVSHGFKYLTYWWALYMQWRAKNDPMVALTQLELNTLYLGPEFRMSYDYAALTTTFCVCLTFSSVIPLMALLGAINFCVSFWVDKYFFLRLYRAPPRFDTSLNSYVTSILPFAVLMNLAIAIWALGNEDIFTPEEDVDDATGDLGGYDSYDTASKVTTRQNIASFITFVILLCSIFAFYFVKTFGGALGVFLKNMFGGIYANMMLEVLKVDVNMNSVDLDYHTAMACHRFKNLATYNMLHNTMYMEALKISKEFADTHRYVDSLSNDHEKKDTRTTMTDQQMRDLRRQAIEKVRASHTLDKTRDDENSDGSNSDVEFSEDRVSQYVWKDIIAEEDDENEADGQV